MHRRTPDPQRCMKDLRERFARINIDQSPPLVPFRETLAPSALTSVPGLPGTGSATPDVGALPTAGTSRRGLGVPRMLGGG